MPKLVDRIETALGWADDPARADDDYFRDTLAFDLWSRSTEDVAARIRWLLKHELPVDPDDVLRIRPDLPDDVKFELLLRTKSLDFPKKLSSTTYELNPARRNSERHDAVENLSRERAVRLAHKVKRGSDLVESPGK